MHEDLRQIPKPTLKKKYLGMMEYTYNPSQRSKAKTGRSLGPAGQPA